jgi:hypothetical protein
VHCQHKVNGLNLFLQSAFTSMRLFQHTHSVFCVNVDNTGSASFLQRPKESAACGRVSRPVAVTTLHFVCELPLPAPVPLPSPSCCCAHCLQTTLCHLGGIGIECSMHYINRQVLGTPLLFRLLSPPLRTTFREEVAVTPPPPCTSSTAVRAADCSDTTFFFTRPPTRHSHSFGTSKVLAINKLDP